MLWNYDARSINSSPRIVISCLCIKKKKNCILFQRHCKCNNPCVARIQVESRLDRNGADIAAAYVCLAESAAHYAEYRINYCCVDNTVVIVVIYNTSKTTRREKYVYKDRFSSKPRVSTASLTPLTTKID